MIKKTTIFIIPGLMFLSIFTQPGLNPQSHNARKDIEIALNFPKSAHSNIITLGNNDTTDDILLIIKNNTDTAASFFENWNMWGYYNASFELKLPDTTLFLYPYKMGWDRNFPSSWMLFPGDSLILPYNINDCNSNKYDCFSNLPEQCNQPAKIRVHYQIQEQLHRWYIESNRDMGYFPLFMTSFHKEKFDKLSLEQKLMSFVTDSLFSEEYDVTIEYLK